jgi:IS5 family transposase
VSFSDFYISHLTRKGNFLNHIDQLIDWQPIEQEIRRHYAPASEVAGHPAYPGLLQFKMLLVGLWHGGLSDEAVEEMAFELFCLRSVQPSSGQGVSWFSIAA